MRAAAVSPLVPLLVALVVPVAAIAGEAVDFPARPVRFIVPYTPGAMNDYIARAIGQKLSETWPHQVVVDNRAGGNTLIGTELAMRAPPDGHTWLLLATAHSINPALFAKLPYDLLRDFAPVIHVATSSMLLVVHPAVPAKSVQELVVAAKAKPGGYTYASTGAGGSAHLMGEMFKSQAGVDILHIPYKGLAPGLTDVISGQVNMTFGTWTAVGAHVKGGRLRALAVTGPKRSAAAPELPTVAEGGLPGYQATSTWGVAVPKAVPSALVERINGHIGRVLANAELRERFAAQGLDITGGTARQFSAFLRADIARWAPVVKASGAKPE